MIFIHSVLHGYLHIRASLSHSKTRAEKQRDEKRAKASEWVSEWASERKKERKKKNNAMRVFSLIMHNVLVAFIVNAFLFEQTLEMFVHAFTFSRDIGERAMLWMELYGFGVCVCVYSTLFAAIIASFTHSHTHTYERERRCFYSIIDLFDVCVCSFSSPFEHYKQTWLSNLFMAVKNIQHLS